MSAGLLAPFKRGRDLLCSWFSLTRSEAGSLLLIFAVLLIGLAARAFYRG